jgi:hypothetical protein
MTFLKRRDETLRTPTKQSRIVFVLVAAAAAISIGYILTLAVLAPQQLAEATTAATDLICDKCVGTSDIADSAVTGAKIGSGQVKNSDIGGNAVTTGKIADGQVFGSDIASLTIGSTDLADSAVTSSKLAGGAVKPNVHKVQGSIVVISPNSNGNAQVDCPAGEILTGGGYSGTIGGVQVYTNVPYDENTWSVGARNVQSGSSVALVAFALCIGAYP